jgi:hypothetical protein
VFVSSHAVSHKPANGLIRGLQRAGVEVGHSPLNPLDGIDPRWEHWYESGLAVALSGCNAFVIVVDAGWDSSTWMAIEAHTGMKVLEDGSRAGAYFWNPEAIVVQAAGMLPYLKQELPRGLDEAISQIVARAG